jgi:hypothetical protein
MELNLSWLVKSCSSPEESPSNLCMPNVQLWKPHWFLIVVLTIFFYCKYVMNCYCLRFEVPPTWRVRSLYLYPPGTGWPSYTPRHWVSFSSPLMAHRATAEVFDPTSTRVSRLRVWVEVWVLCYDRRSVGQSVLEQSTTTRQLRFCFCGAPSLTRGRVCHVLGSVDSSKSTVRIYKYLHFTCFTLQEYIYNIYKASVSPGQVQQIMPYF